MGRRLVLGLMSVAVVLAFATAPAAAAIPPGNLLQDPGAEADTGSTDSSCGAGAVLGGAWNGGGGAFTVVRYGTSGYPGTDVSNSIGGGQNFFTGGCSADTYAAQVIDVRGYGADIQTGNIQATLSGDLGGYLTQEDSADVYAQFESCNDTTVLDTVSIGPVTAADRNNQTTLLPRSGTKMVPTGTCFINVVMHFHRVTGTDNDGTADNVSLSLVDLSTRTLTVNVAGTGSGTVTGDQSPQIQCQPTCQQAYQTGTVVTLTAAPSSRSTFTGWSGACSGTDTTCVVTLNADTTATATFSPANSSSVPINTRPPSISGTARQYEVLSSDGGLWSGGVTSLSYQWLRCTAGGGNCLNIPGATSPSYTLTGDDVGSTIRVRVTAHNATGPSAPADSDPSAVVMAGVVTAHLTITPNPSCTGTPTLLDASGSVSPDGIRSYSFSFIDFWQWFDDHYVPQSELEIEFGIALETDALTGNQGAAAEQYLIDHYSSAAVVTGKPTLTETFDWNREYWVSDETDPIYFTAVARDPVGVVLVVTDYAGHTARTTAVLPFTQFQSIQSRTKCPKVQYQPGSIPRLAALAALRYTGGTGLSARMSCTARTTCVGAIVVSKACKRCATKARTKLPGLLAHGFFQIPPHKTGRVRLILTKQGKSALRRLRRGRSLKVAITESSVDAFGRRRVRSYSSVITR